MPIFEYRCGKCKKVSAFLERSSVKTKLICEHCGSKKLEKIFSTFSAQSISAGSKQTSGGCFPSCSQGFCPNR